MKRVIAWGVAASLLGYTVGGSAVGVTQSARSISASDKATGAKAHPELLQEYGGAYTGPQAAYVRGVGQKIAVQSGLSNSQSDFTVTLLNSPVNNAFAIPGGYVYVTRQLLALMNDEAELASVLGHEVGHVAARHANKRNTTSTIGSVLAGVLGAVTGSSALGQLASSGAQLVTLRFSRQQEYQADDLGISYLARAGYDPYAAADMLAALNAQTALDADIKGGDDARAVPSWMSTHPNGADRVARARQQATTTGIAITDRQRNGDAFLARLDGLLYDDDPAQGMIDGTNFRHPKLRIGFTAPAGYRLANSPSAVSISGTGGQAQFSGGALGSGLPAYVDGVFRKLGGAGAPDTLRQMRVNGLPAAYATARATSGQRAVDITVFAYQMGTNDAYHFMLVTPSGSGIGPFAPMVQGFARLTDAQAAAIKPRRIEIVTVKSGDSVGSLASRMGYADQRVERFRTINALAGDARLRVGQKVKLIVAG
ncbi:M48 family metalloprotease [Sphingomonas solaris]|uniref:M48 family metalloprotease n=1 Tax=Alterirhizorhabdus solaris TaxID=2529389 RepID=A0A558QXH6_9SPHN|nr:M48 family metalloprotease [Sphingomonas solaris]TVV71851.1 M48 family metalloprotease [Sphingomonas solaris]